MPKGVNDGDQVQVQVAVNVDDQVDVHVDVHVALIACCYLTASTGTLTSTLT